MPHVYIGSEYRQNSVVRNIIVKGKPESDAGYTVAVFAVLVPGSVPALLQSVAAEYGSWQQTRLPSNSLATARLDTTRNGDIARCAPVGE